MIPLEEVAIINANFDKMINDFKQMAVKSRATMPLVAQSCELTVSLIKVYKEAFNVANKKRK